MNKFVARGLVGTLVSLFVLVILEASMSSELYDGLTSIVGIGMLTFMIWASVILFKTQK